MAGRDLNGFTIAAQGDSTGCVHRDGKLAGHPEGVHPSSKSQKKLGAFPSYLAPHGMLGEKPQRAAALQTNRVVPLEWRRLWSGVAHHRFGGIPG